MTSSSKNRGLGYFLQFLAAEKWIAIKWMEIDKDNLQIGTAIGYRTSCEH